MRPNPIFGAFLHCIGGLMSATFYVPYRGVRKWSWETAWLAGGVVSWLIVPAALAAATVPNLAEVFREAPRASLAWSYVFGVLWGIGGLGFGLTMRYLGLSLGNAIALGWCAAFGTLIPPIFDGKIHAIMSTHAGHLVLLGILVCLSGIIGSGLAGLSKERDLPAERQVETIKEFNFPKGVLVAVMTGIMSSCMSFGIAAGKPVADVAVRLGTATEWQYSPVFVVILVGGFTTNFVWCATLLWRRHTVSEYWSAAAPLARNYLLAAVAGATWYMQFMFYGIGTTYMGRYDFSSWTLHMASIMIFGTLWGIALGEWRGVSKRTLVLLSIGLAALVASTILVGYGNHVASIVEEPSV